MFKCYYLPDTAFHARYTSSNNSIPNLSPSSVNVASYIYSTPTISSIYSKLLPSLTYFTVISFYQVYLHSCWNKLFKADSVSLVPPLSFCSCLNSPSALAILKKNVISVTRWTVTAVSHAISPISFTIMFSLAPSILPSFHPFYHKFFEYCSLTFCIILVRSSWSSQVFISPLKMLQCLIPFLTHARDSLVFINEEIIASYFIVEKMNCRGLLLICSSKWSSLDCLGLCWHVCRLCLSRLFVSVLKWPFN